VTATLRLPPLPSEIVMLQVPTLPVAVTWNTLVDTGSVVTVAIVASVVVAVKNVLPFVSEAVRVAGPLLPALNEKLVGAAAMTGDGVGVGMF
jgi:hypothetical protein